MQIKYKCRDDNTEEVFTNIKGYLLDDEDEDEVRSILLTGNERERRKYNLKK